MSVWKISGGNKLYGDVRVQGSKNAVLPIMAASIVTGCETEIINCPQLSDVDAAMEILRHLGCRAEREKDIVNIDSRGMTRTDIPRELMSEMRSSVIFLGAILARTHAAQLTYPGGCELGARPIDMHLDALRCLGARVEENGGKLDCRDEGLTGTRIELPFPSVGATENLMMAASLAQGTTIIENAAQEPEIVDLATLLNKMGARIKGAGTDTIKIEGVEGLHGASHNVIPDRIEAGTFMVAAAITRGSVLLRNVLPDHLKPIIAKLRECGVRVDLVDDDILVSGAQDSLISTDIKTLPYPGFPTDMQPQFMSLLATVDGSSVVIETVFENRYMHVAELNRMGASIRTEDRCAIIAGRRNLKGTKVVATDLRAGAAVVLAGLVAEGMTEVSEIYHIERGYEHFVEKIRNLGGQIEKVEEDKQ